MSDPIPQQTGRESVSFAGADGARIDAWLYRPDPHVSTGTTIVMAHGIGGIKSAGLAPIAERFAAAGHTCVLFDYRHFGASEGSPRELLHIRAERDDYQAALEFAAGYPKPSAPSYGAARSPDCTQPGMPATTSESRRPSASAHSSTGRTRHCRSRSDSPRG